MQCTSSKINIVFAIIVSNYNALRDKPMTGTYSMRYIFFDILEYHVMYRVVCRTMFVDEFLNITMVTSTWYLCCI